MLQLLLLEPWGLHLICLLCLTHIGMRLRLCRYRCPYLTTNYNKRRGEAHKGRAIAVTNCAQFKKNVTINDGLAVRAANWRPMCAQTNVGSLRTPCLSSLQLCPGALSTHRHRLRCLNSAATTEQVATDCTILVQLFSDSTDEPYNIGHVCRRSSWIVLAL